MTSLQFSHSALVLGSPCNNIILVKMIQNHSYNHINKYNPPFFLVDIVILICDNKLGNNRFVHQQVVVQLKWISN